MFYIAISVTRLHHHTLFFALLLLCCHFFCWVELATQQRLVVIFCRPVPPPTYFCIIPVQSQMSTKSGGQPGERPVSLRREGSGVLSASTSSNPPAAGADGREEDNAGVGGSGHLTKLVLKFTTASESDVQPSCEVSPCCSVLLFI